MTDPAPLRKGPGRPPGFDREAVLERALDLLWEGGFEATPIGELIDAMGLSRSSFYAAFGSKRGVMLAAIRFYSARAIAELRVIAGARADRCARLRRVIERLATIDEDRGCFMVNCIAELGRRDPEVHAIARAHTDAVEALIADLLPEEPGFDRSPCARALVAAAFGATLLTASGADRASIRAMLAALLGRI